MRHLAISILLLCCICRPLMAHKYDESLSGTLTRDFEKIIKQFPAGREVYARLKKAGPRSRELKVLVRRDPLGNIAFYNDVENIVYFNSDLMSGFFALKGASAETIIELLHRDPKAREVFVARADSTYLHELVHALQSYLYPDYRKDMPKGIPLEFEYEAYLIGDMYTHQRMKRSPELLKEYIGGAGLDIYTSVALNGYLSLSLDLETYKENIRKRYEEEIGGFISLEKAEAARRNSVEDSRIIAYASGRVTEYSDEKAGLKGLRSQKAAYAEFLDNYYRNKWPSFSADALFFIGSTAMEKKNYPLALECFAGADVNAVKNGAGGEGFKKLREKGALAILEAASFVKDRSSAMGAEELSRHLRALEKACDNTGRPFPENLRAVRAANYPAAFKFYSAKADSEKDPARAAFYKENRDYFLQALDRIERPEDK